MVRVTLTQHQASFNPKESISESLRISSGLGLDSDLTYSGFSLDSVFALAPPQSK